MGNGIPRSKSEIYNLRSAIPNPPSKIFHLTAVFEEFNMMLTKLLAIGFANVTVNSPLNKVFSHGK
jgi:hypothetical protein